MLLTNVKKKVKCNVYFKSDPLGNLIKLENNKEGKCPSADLDGKVKLTSYEINDAMICSIPDDYGTSYYYRGPVKNNYVYFANIYWRIIRINGDGSIRMIYDGTKAHENNEVAEDKIVGYSAFNDKTNDNTYVGYMYGTPSSSTYEETHANINDSTVKKYVDNWYENNINGSMNEQHIADNIFCNDKTMIGNITTSSGAGKAYTQYRWNYGPYDNNSNSKITIKCLNLNDAFTVNDNINGNSALKYSVSMLSTDEVVLAGGYKENNKIYFLYSGVYSWSISPYRYDNNYSHIRGFDSSILADDANISYRKLGVKPVINLKANSLKSGDGTINNPYMLSGN